MRSTLEILSTIITAALFYYIGYTHNKLVDKINKLSEKEPEVGVTKTDPRFRTSNLPDNDKDVGITTPKSPQLLEWEAEQALRTLNDSYKVKPE